MSAKAKGWLGILLSMVIIIPQYTSYGFRISSIKIDAIGFVFLLQLIFPVLAIYFGMQARKADAKLLGLLAVTFGIIGALPILATFAMSFAWCGVQVFSYCR